MDFTVQGGETSQDIVRLIRKAQLMEVARGYHEWDRRSFQEDRSHKFESCRRHMRYAIEAFNYAEED